MERTNPQNEGKKQLKINLVEEQKAEILNVVTDQISAGLSERH